MSSARRRSRPDARTAASPPVPVPAVATARVDLWVAAALVVVTVALYWPVHGYEFVNLDDFDYVRQNPPVLAGLTAASVRWAATSLYMGFWIPLTWLSLMADAQVYGTGAGGFHVTNVVL